jgi:hypothetical protein
MRSRPFGKHRGVLALLVLASPGVLLAQGLALERDLTFELCITESALARMHAYKEEHPTSPARSIVVEEKKGA